MNIAIFSIFPILIASIGLFFKRRQNKGVTVGGNISTPKALWLSYTVGSWFFLPILFLFWPIDQGVKYVIIFHLSSFWIRGVLELFMIYKWYNWSPIHGISHDLFHFFGVAILFKYFWPMEVNRPTLMTMIYIYSILISVGFETVFAIFFLKIRGKEKHKIYFADNSAQWKFVNYLTYFAVLICYGLLLFNAWFIRELAI